VHEVEREVEHGRVEWKVEITKDGVTYDIRVDSLSGAVTRVDTDDRDDRTRGDDRIDDRIDDHGGDRDDRDGDNSGPGSDNSGSGRSGGDDDSGGDRSGHGGDDKGGDDDR
jgi:hypothetical protein